MFPGLCARGRFRAWQQLGDPLKFTSFIPSFCLHSQSHRRGPRSTVWPCCALPNPHRGLQVTKEAHPRLSHCGCGEFWALPPGPGSEQPTVGSPARSYSEALLSVGKGLSLTLEGPVMDPRCLQGVVAERGLYRSSIPAGSKALAGGHGAWESQGDPAHTPQRGLGALPSPACARDGEVGRPLALGPAHSGCNWLQLEGRRDWGLWAAAPWGLLDLGLGAREEELVHPETSAWAEGAPQAGPGQAFRPWAPVGQSQAGCVRPMESRGPAHQALRSPAWGTAVPAIPHCPASEGL